MAYPNLDSLFKAHCPKFVVDDKFIKNLSTMMYRFINRNDEHIHFFGGNLTGVHKMRFTTADKNQLFVDLMQMDDPSQCQEDLYDVPDINKEWAVSSDLFNILCLWISHRIEKSTLNNKKKEDGHLAIYLLLHFKMLGSFLSQFFPHPVNPETAKATYDALSLKFSLKRHGTWLKSLEARCKDIYSDKSIRRQTIEKFEPTKEVIRMINDIENRLRIRIRRIASTMHVVIAADRKHQISGGSIVLDGEMVLKDVIRDHSQYEQYITRVSTSVRDFIKVELVEVVNKEYPSAPHHALIKVLEYFCYVMASSKNRNARDYINEMVIHVFEQMKENPTTLGRAMKDPLVFIGSMKNLYTASKSNNPQVLKMRDISFELVDKAVAIRDTNTLLTLRNAFMLYIVIRMFTRDHYSK